MSGDWSDFGYEAGRPAPDARRPRAYEPSVEYVAGEMAQVSISLDNVPPDETAWRQEIQRVTGLPVPPHRRVELAQVRYWGNPEAPNVYCRFLIEDREDAPVHVDAVQILHDLREGRPERAWFDRNITQSPADSTFVLSWNDWQLGKLEAGGTEGFARRFNQAMNETEARIQELRTIGRDISELVIIGGGDIIEGCAIFANQPHEIDSDRRAQIRNATTFILAGLDRLAPLFDRVRVLVVGGNHGENRINGKRTTRHDNDDCAVFEHAALACSRDGALDHVSFYIAQDEPAKTLDVHGWIVGTTHGQVLRGGSGGVSAKAHRWFSGQAAGRLAAGDADLLITHHYHHYQAQDWGACMWVQTPAMDGGSPFFTDSSGMHSRPGMLSWVMDAERRFYDMQILDADGR